MRCTVKGMAFKAGERGDTVVELQRSSEVLESLVESGRMVTMNLVQFA